jgi:predicted secreted protein
MAPTFVVVAFVGLFACHRVRGAEKAYPVIEAATGQEFTISLASNPSTGYRWQMAKPLDETIVKSVRNNYQAPARKAGEPPMPGSGERNSGLSRP